MIYTYQINTYKPSLTTPYKVQPVEKTNVGTEERNKEDRLILRRELANDAVSGRICNENTKFEKIIREYLRHQL